MEESKKQLTRLFRPKTFDEVVGQVEAKTVLKNAVANNSLLNFIVLEGTMGSGKCINENEYILTNSGYAKASIIRPTREATTIPFELDVTNDKHQRVKTAYYYSNGKKPCLKITTLHGYEISVTNNHPLKVLLPGQGFEWVRADDLTKGMQLKIMLTSEHDTSKCSNLAIYEAVAHIYASIFNHELTEGESLESTIELYPEHKKILEDLNGWLSSDSMLPEILNAPIKAQRAFISTFIYLAGVCNIQNNHQLTSLSLFNLPKEFAKQFQLMLLNFRVFSDRQFNSDGTCTLTISKQWLTTLRKYLRINKTRKHYDLTKLSESPQREQIVFDKTALPYFECTFLDNSTLPTLIEAWKDYPQGDFLKELYDTVLDPIINIEYAGELETLDFNVPDGSSFVASGFSNHNTTMARIYSKAVNCLHPVDGNPCGECEHCKEIEEGNSPDILEVDAASKRTIDAMRDVLKQLDYETFSLPYRVLILDEVHMLTQEAWNVLLKSLEEPNPHTIWIFATTNAEKIPDPIMSRAVTLSVRRVKSADIVQHLEKICHTMGWEYETKALEVISRRSQGVLRDSVKNLDTLQSVFNGELTYKNAQNIFSYVDSQTILDFIGTIYSQDISVALSESMTIEQMFANTEKFLRQLYVTTLACIKHKLHCDLSEEYGQDEITAIGQTCKNIPTKFLWKLLNVTHEQLQSFDSNLPQLDYIVVKMKDNEVEEKLNLKEDEKKEEAPQFNLENELDDI